MRALLSLAALLAGPALAQTAGPKVPITTLVPPPSSSLNAPSRGAALPGAAVAKAEAPATDAPRQAAANGVLVLYGNQHCPTNRDGQEVVVCVRRAPGEQYRVPKELRNFVITPENQSWAAKAQDTMSAGAATGIGSCTAVGPGGASGCTNMAMRADRTENKQRAQEQRNIP